MIRDLVKWVVPGLATVLGGTTLCVAMTSADITSDLAAKTGASMAAGGYDWAELSFDMRDVKVSGTTTDQAILQAAIARLDAIGAVRSIASDVTLAPLASPYVLTAAIAPHGPTLSGGVPDETTRQQLLGRAGLSTAELALRSGMPDRAAWTAGAGFAIDNLKYLDQGTISVSDLTVNLNGRAKSERDYRDLLVVLRAGPPSGLTMGEVAVTPALVAPYQWSASFDGKRIDVTGFVPDDAIAERLRMADVAGLPVATGLTLGSGEPEGFASLSQSLIEQLAKLEYGSASISGAASTLTGAPPTIEIAQAIVDTLKPSGSIVVLEPPRIADYWASATRQAGGTVVFDGYAPDEAAREALSQRPGADTTWLKLGRGAPERYQSGMDFGPAALDLLSEGRFALRDNVLTISGVARTAADYDAVRATLAQGAPQGLVMALAEIQAPRSDAYNWQVSKDATGAIALSGLVPSPEAEAVLLAGAGETASATMSYASGEPNNFVATAQTSIDLLSRLREGRVAFDGAGWTITGTANSATDKSALEADFASKQLAAAGWSMAVAEAAPAATPAEPAPEPEPPIVVAEPAVEPEPVAESAVEPTPVVEATPAVEPEPAPLPEPAAPTPAPVATPAVPATAAADLAACAAPVAQFTARNAIFFRSGAAAIAAESNAALDELAIDLAACPSATVHIEGHTDTDGDEGPNMALSVSRAEAVVSALVLRGVAPDRLYAVGYGETLPIADNATAEGKRMNRRIVVTVRAGD